MTDVASRIAMVDWDHVKHKRYIVSLHQHDLNGKSGETEAGS